jgi:hypothetical protein
MINKKIQVMRVHSGLLSFTAMLILSQSVFAQQNIYEISSSTQSGGGGLSSGGEFSVVGTVGQSATGPIRGGEFQFLSGYLANECVIYAPSDLNFDGDTNAADLGVFLLNWGECPNGILGCPGDVNYDSHIDAQDLGRILIEWE